MNQVIQLAKYITTLYSYIEKEDRGHNLNKSTYVWVTKYSYDLIGKES